MLLFDALNPPPGDAAPLASLLFRTLLGDLHSLCWSAVIYYCWLNWQTFLRMLFADVLYIQDRVPANMTKWLLLPLILEGGVGENRSVMIGTEAFYIWVSLSELICLQWEACDNETHVSALYCLNRNTAALLEVTGSTSLSLSLLSGWLGK